ncbi:hypothetical protein niasHS_009937 [Heterodera schachtii]|uniref:Uncharacterized protein n=1 Tax=Heterodera schachtii TaxID=97005 RepID=A0ABD2JCZ3_HETSC
MSCIFQCFRSLQFAHLIWRTLISSSLLSPLSPERCSLCTPQFRTCLIAKLSADRPPLSLITGVGQAETSFIIIGNSAHFEEEDGHRKEKQPKQPAHLFEKKRIYVNRVERFALQRHVTEFVLNCEPEELDWEFFWFTNLPFQEI